MSKTTEEENELREFVATLEYIIDVSPFTEMSIDPAIQRPENPPQVESIAREFDPNALGMVHGSLRADGTQVILDGQHRYKAALKVGYAGNIAKKIFMNLTLDQEARLFRLLNNTTKVSALALFNSSIAEGNAFNIAIRDMFLSHNIKIGNGNFMAVGAAQRIAARKGGMHAMEWALCVMLDTWDVPPWQLDGRVLEALSSLYLRDGVSVDRQRLIKVLTGAAGGIDGLLGRARTLMEARKGKIVGNIIEAMVRAYNHNTRKYSLEEWK